MDTTVTEQKGSDVVQDDLEVNEEITELKEGEVEGEVKTDAEDGSDGTAPPKADAEEAKNAYKYREEKRLRKEIEAENAALKAQMSVKVSEKPAIPVIPIFDNFESNADFVEAMTRHNQAMADYHEKLTDWKLEERDNLSKAEQAQNDLVKLTEKLQDSYDESADKAAEKYPDYFDKVEKTTYNYSIKEAVLKSENKAEIAYHIANNPELNAKLLDSSPVEIAMEINKIDMRLTHSLKSKKSSSAPEPIDPVEGAGEGVEKKTDDMSDAEWHKYYKREKEKKIKQPGG